MLTELEDVLLSLPALAAVSRRKNPLNTGESVLPAVSLEYGYRLGEDVKISELRESLTVSLATSATENVIGSVDIDVHLSIVEEITLKIEAHYFLGSTCRARFVLETGGDVTRRNGFCQSEIRFVRNRFSYRSA